MIPVCIHITSIISLFWATVLFFLIKDYYFELHTITKWLLSEKSYVFMSVILILDEDKQ
jgi:hypothetical protein